MADLVCDLRIEEGTTMEELLQTIGQFAKEYGSERHEGGYGMGGVVLSKGITIRFETVVM